MGKSQRRDTCQTNEKNTEQIAEKRKVFGIARHRWSDTKAKLGENEAVVSNAQAGDFYRFMRNVGGGGGHELIVKRFRVIATLSKYRVPYVPSPLSRGITMSQSS